MFHVQGYVVRSSLPPILSVNQYVNNRICVTYTENGCRLPKKPSTARQVITVTGLGYHQFDECARSILEAHRKLASGLPVNTLNVWTPIKDRYICLEFSNRYFTGSSDGFDHADVPLSTTVDPQGILQDSFPEGRHTEDNTVLYYDRIFTDEGR